MQMPLEGRQENIELVEELPAISTESNGLWRPTMGRQTALLLENAPAESKETILSEAAQILSNCVPPDANTGSRTGLVIGYVQSGKTLSFTAVSALANDNHYQVIVVITGTSINLFRQSNDRLKDDLRLGRRGSWKYYRSDSLDTTARQSLDSALARWHDPTVRPEERQTIILTVMKERTHLDRLIRLLQGLKYQASSALIIDDEADQASLNNMVNKGEQSATYRRLLQLRSCFPNHTYLQYTATPQAPLLINVIDSLSPEFAQVLTPGPEYTGGITFFEQNLELVRDIPENDIPTPRKTLAEPPESLLEAMRVFFLGLAADLLEPEQHNRSMMVHPSKATTQHQDYCLWVKSIMRRWQRTLQRPQGQDFLDLIDEFRPAFDDLASTVLRGLPSFDRLLEVLPRALRETVVTEVNAREDATPEVNWDRDCYHILVGGQALDRGYTVKGLTVTYMPRGRGVGNADTIQQRARWFGYKEGYLGYCRVYLAETTRRAYQAYVEHEEDIRQRLREYRGSLRDWRRAFFLSPTLSPTRNSVLDLDYMRGNFGGKWFEVRAPHISNPAIEENRALVELLKGTYAFLPAEGSPERLPTHRHLVARNIPLEEFFSCFLTPFSVAHPNDSNRYTGLLLQLKRSLELNPGSTCTVYLMSPQTPRERSVNEKNEIAQLYQGPHPDKRGTVYPGDRKIREAEGLTIQIHVLSRVLDDTQVLAHDVPVLAAWVPRSMSGYWLVQRENGNNGQPMQVV